MNELEHTPYNLNERQWYFLSIYYAREKWGKLIAEIMQYYHEHKNLFCAYFISFSKQKGEHLELTFVSFENDNYNFSDEIYKYFLNFLDRNPSVSKITFPYGKAIWCDYPNNSLMWDNFKWTYYSERYFHLYQNTLFAMMSLNNEDFSENTSFSIGMYLISKGLFCIDTNEQKNILSQIFYTVSKDINEKQKVDSWIKEHIKKYDIEKVCNTIESYKKENESEYSEKLKIWIDEVEKSVKSKEYHFLYLIICRITGLTTLNQLVILSLLNKWFEVKC